MLGGGHGLHRVRIDVGVQTAGVSASGCEMIEPP
jgi:hypothetical protein